MGVEGRVEAAARDLRSQGCEEGQLVREEPSCGTVSSEEEGTTCRNKGNIGAYARCQLLSQEGPPEATSILILP